MPHTGTFDVSSDDKFIDLNGDGFTDILSNNYDPSGLQIKFYTGKTFIIETIPISQPYMNGNICYSYTYLPADFDGDGRIDLLQYRDEEPDAIPEGQPEVIIHKAFIWLNKPTGWACVPVAQELHSPGIYASLHDIQGDGVPDLFSYTDYSMQCTPFSVSQPSAKVKTITNGMNVSVDIAYKPLTDNTVYTKGNRAVYPLNDVCNAMQVVSSVTSETGTGSLQTSQYTYKNALLHRTGRGYIGFMETAVFNTLTGAYAQNTAEVDMQHYVPLPKSSITKVNNKILSESTSVYDSIPFDGKRYFIYPSQTVAKAYDFDTQNLLSVTYGKFVYDTKGNVTQTESSCGNVKVTTVNTYDYLTNPQQLHRLVSTVTTKTNGTESISQTTNFTYDTKGFQVSQTQFPDKPEYTVTVSQELNDFGLPVKTTTSATGLTPVYSTVQYDEKGRFVTASANMLKHTSSAWYDAAFGVPVKQTDANGLTVTNSYGNFGAWAKTAYPTGTTSSVATLWTSAGEGPAGAVYKTVSQTTGIAQAIVYFDKFGRSLRSQTLGFGNKTVVSDIEYNVFGQVFRKSNSYFLPVNTDDTTWITYKYDELGRNTAQYGKGIWTIAQFSGYTSTITNKLLNTTTTKTVDMYGQIVQSTDAGGSVNYTYYLSGLPKTITAAGAVTTMEYDLAGRRTKITDPNKGTILTTYNAYGQVTSDTTAKGKTQFEYDAIGRTIKRTEPDNRITTWVYDTKGIGLISSTGCNNGTAVSYDYDRLKRLYKTTKTIDGTNYVTRNTFDALGRTDSVVYPNTYAVKHHYHAGLGYLERISNKGNTLWKLTNANAMGQITKFTWGNNQTTTKTYNILGQTTGITTGTIQNLQYTYNTLTYQMKTRSGMQSFTEQFEFDNLNRLTTVKNQTTLAIVQQTAYYNNGNIQSKTDAGNYGYDPDNKPHAVVAVSEPKPSINLNQDITFTSFDKVDFISDGSNNSYSIAYGTNHERVKTVFVENNQTTTKYYVGQYEKEIKSDGKIRELLYLSAGDGIFAIVERVNGGAFVPHYIHKDHLGSIQAITNSSGVLEQRWAYDAWGVRSLITNSCANTTTFLFDRGYTMHEHLETFKLINMNGRVYDPVLGRFLSPDNFVQDAGSTQAYNRYTYCLNNPLVYTDPSGWITAEDYWANISHILRSNAYPYGAKIGRFGEIQKFNTPEDAFFAASEYLEQFNAWDRTCFRSYTHYASWFNSNMTTTRIQPVSITGPIGWFLGKLGIGKSFNFHNGNYGTTINTTKIIGGVSLQNPYDTWQTLIKDVVHSKDMYNSCVPYRLDPIDGKPQDHTAYDIGYNNIIKGNFSKTSIVTSAAEGRVIISNESYGGYGKHIEIDHEQGYVSTYSHLSNINVKVGDYVYNGQSIGIVGNTGHSAGVHLHFELKYNNILIVPHNLCKNLQLFLHPEQFQGTWSIVSSPTFDY